MSILAELMLKRDLGRDTSELNAFFGNGADGNATISSPTSLARDMYYDTLTVNSQLNTRGYRIFAKTAIINNGLIYNNGYDGDIVDFSSPTGGGSGAPLVSYLTTPGLMRGGGDGGGPDTTGENVTGIGGFGGGGGAGDAFPGQPGGTSRVLANAGGLNTSVGFYPTRNPFFAVSMVAVQYTQKIGGGGGGGGGGSGVSTSGGAGGGGGGVIMLSSPSISGSGTIQAKGGNGIEGTDVGFAGGGGGGGGGVIVMLTKNGHDPNLTLDVSGGTGANGPVAEANPGSPGTIISMRLE